MSTQDTRLHWCVVHHRPATHTNTRGPCCDPSLCGIMLPCKTAPRCFSNVRRITRLRDVPVPAWVWCSAGGYDTGWWRADRWWDRFTIGDLTHWHPWQPEAPEVTP